MPARLLLRLADEAITAKERKMRLAERCERTIVERTDRPFVTRDGRIEPGQLAAPDGTRLRVGGADYVVLTPSFLDRYEQLERGAQVMLAKDLAIIAAHTGINGSSRVLDAGSGSGASAIFFAHLVREVLSLDVDERHLRRAQENAAPFALANLTFSQHDVYAGLDAGRFDLFVLDVPEPWRARATAERSVCPGGHLVAYTPQISQAQRVVREFTSGWLHERTLEVSERDWLVSERQLRPQTMGALHTGFLTFLRRIGADTLKNDGGS